MLCLKTSKHKDEETAAAPKTVNIVVGFFWLVNYQMGAGFLGIPFSFVHGGLLAGIATLLVVSLICWITSNWILEVLARAQAITQLKLSESDATLPISTYLSPNRKFEATELTNIFLGRWAKYLYLLMTSVSSFLTLIGCSVIAGSAWSINLPLKFTGVAQCTASDFLLQTIPSDLSCRHAYWFCLFLFACIVVPLSMVELRQQAIVQLILSFLRFITIGTIVIFCAANLISSVDICKCAQPWVNASLLEPFDNQCNETTSLTSVVTHFDFRYWTVSIPVLLFSFNINQSLPYLIHPIKQKKHLGTLLHIDFVVIAIAYLVIGVTISLWWRECINETCSLNWGPLTHPSYALSLRILSYSILLFPTVLVISAYSFNVINISNNVFVCLLGKDTADPRNTWASYSFLLLLKFFSALIPVLVAMGVSNLVTVFKYIGIIEFLISVGNTTILQIRSQWVCKQRFKAALKKNVDIPHHSTNNGDYDDFDHDSTEKDLLVPSHVKPSHLYMTPYSSVFSYWPAVIIVTAVCFVMFGLNVFSIFV